MITRLNSSHSRSLIFSSSLRLKYIYLFKFIHCIYSNRYIALLDFRILKLMFFIYVYSVAK